MVKSRGLKEALSNIDWGQVVANGGPPCFFVERNRGQFCLRAERWHDTDGHSFEGDHLYVSLKDLIASCK